MYDPRVGREMADIFLDSAFTDFACSTWGVTRMLVTKIKSALGFNVALIPVWMVM